jgi:hypothetical protein
MSGPPNISFEKIGSPALRFAAASPSLTGTAPQLPRDLVIDKLYRRKIMELAINARIAHLENTSRSLNRRIDRTEYFADMIDWHAMTNDDCRLISMQEEHLAETLAETEMELDFRSEQLCWAAH